MKMNSTAVRTRFRRSRFSKFMRKHRGTTKVIAMSLAFIMALSALSANVSSIVKLLETYAANYTVLDDFYPVDIELYDYYSDEALRGSDVREPDFTIFNNALYYSGYASKAGYDDGLPAATANDAWTQQNLNYFPLYQGLQYPNQGDGKNKMIYNVSNAFNYSIVANSQAGTGDGAENSGAAVGLVDKKLANGVITQGNGTVALPYFDEKFITATKLSQIFPEGKVPTKTEGNTQVSLGDSYLGRIDKGGQFVFRKVADNDPSDYKGTYLYDSSQQFLKYTAASAATNNKWQLQVEANEGNGAVLIKDNKGDKSAFFPWDVKEGKSSGHESTNFGYGVKFTIPFNMTTTGYLTNPSTGEIMKDGSNNPIPIKFGFSGDDDVWVYIDDMLVLDVGGAHGEVSGTIDFAAKTAKTDRVKATTYYIQNGNSSITAGTAKSLKSLLGEQKFNSLYNDVSVTHTMTVFYLERGTLESNCKLSFNFQAFDTLDVRSKVKSDNVSKWFKTEAENVANREAAKFEIQSNGAGVNVASPDAGKPTNGKLESKKECTVQWSESEYGLSGSKKVAPGETVKLPDGFNVRPGYYILGWHKSGDPNTLYNSYTVPSSAGDGATYSFVDPVWAKVPDTSTQSAPTIDTVPDPAYMIVRTSDKNITTSDNDKRPSKYLGHYGFDNDSYFKKYYFINLTTEADTLGWRISVDNQGDAPVNNSEYPFHDGTNGKIRSDSGNLVNAQLGNFFYWEVDDQNSSTMRTLGTSSLSYDGKVYYSGNEESGYNGNPGLPFYNGYYTSDSNVSNLTFSNEKLQTFINNQASLKTALEGAHDKLVNRVNNGEDVTTDLETYKSALNTYMKALPDTGTNYTTLINNLNGFADATYVDPGTVTTTTSYKYAQKRSFYVYSASGAPSVTITTDMSQYGNLSTNDIVEIEQAFADENSLPVGATSSNDYSWENYYLVTVPTKIVGTVSQTKDNETTVLSAEYHDIAYNVAGSAKTGTEIVNLMNNDPYSCYYVPDSMWRSIRDVCGPSGTNNMFWVYSMESQPSLTYASYDGEGGTKVAVTELPGVIFENGAAPGYYGYRVPTQIKNYQTGEIYNNVKATLTVGSATKVFDITDGKVDTQTVSGLPMCYYASGVSDVLNDAWKDLRTVEVDEGLDEYSYIYIWKDSNTIFPKSSYGYNDNKTSFGKDAASGVQFYYLPNDSNFQFIIKKSGGDKLLANNISLPNSDSYYTSSGATEIGATNPYYDLTAARKMSTLVNVTASMSARKRSSADISLEYQNSLEEPQTEGDPMTSGDGETEPKVIAEIPDPDDTQPADDTQPGEGESQNRSGAGNAQGQFTNSGTNYETAGGVNFKLFDSAKDDLSKVQSAVRKTTTGDNGGFYLLFDQTARFTSQFSRSKGLKIAATGDGVLYSSRYEANDTTQGTGYEKVTGDSADEDNKGLYRRYSTRWILSDDNKGKVTSNRDNYNVYLKSGTYTGNAATRDYEAVGAVDFNNIESDAATNASLHLTATYESTILTGSLHIKKELTQEAKTQITNSSGYNPVFKFGITFSNIFNGGSDDATYTGTNAVYYLRKTDGSDYLTTGDTNGTSTTTNPEDAVRNITDGVAQINYQQLNADYEIVISGIPVQTDFTVTETLPDDSGKPKQSLKTVTSFIMSNTSQSYTGDPVTATGNTTDLLTVPSEINPAGVEPKTGNDGTGPAVGTQTTPIAQYYTQAATNPTDIRLVVLNDIESAYIFLGKKIDHHYYYTVEGAGDNPAGLYNSTVTVGAQTSDETKDLNGYQAATGAEQSFIYKIEKFANGADMSDDDNIQATFYEVISFDSSKSVGIYYYKKIKADPNCDYRITELTDWSWKYALSGDASVEDGSGSGAVAIITSFPGVTLESGSQLILNSTVAAPTEVQTNSARADYTNNKVTNNKKDVEGDTSIKRNSIRVAG